MNASPRHLLVAMLLALTAHPLLAGSSPPAPFRASSVLTLEGKTYGPGLALDGDLSTHYLEGAAGVGIGEWIEVDFRPPRPLARVTVFGGVFESREAFEDNTHVRSATVVVTRGEGEERFTLNFLDLYAPVTLEVPPGPPCRRLRLVIDGIHAGARYSDAAIAEIAFDVGLPDPALVNKLVAWRSSKEGSRQLEEARKTLREGIARLEQGESSAMSLITEAIRLGLRPERAWLRRNLEPGYLPGYVEPDSEAVEAVKRLQLVAAIPALEQAALLVNDPALSRYYQEIVDYLRATERLNQPPRAHIPAWGTTGDEPGAFSSRGEGLSIAVDGLERLYVADVGNNRIQRFDALGRVEKVVGAARGLETVFLEQPVGYYVVGSRAGTHEGAFTQPLSVVILERGETFLAVLDAARRIVLLREDLSVVRTFSVETREPLLSGVGMTGPVMLAVPQGLVCLWGRDLLLYSLEGVLLKRAILPERARAAAVSRGRIIVHFGGSRLCAYGADGFDYGDWTTLEPTQLTEDVELASGEKGSIYVLTDLGWLLRFDRRGRLLRSLEIKRQLGHTFHLALGSETAYITALDRIYPVQLPP